MAVNDTGLQTEELNVHVVVYTGSETVKVRTCAFKCTFLAEIVKTYVIGVVLAIFLLLAKGNFSHKIESIEKICFIITFLAIVCSFILLYKPI